MLGRPPATSLRHLFDGFWPSARIVGLWPGIKAFGGMSVLDERSDQTETLERMGALEVRLARNSAEVRQAQKVRYQVFYLEGGATPDIATLLARRRRSAPTACCARRWRSSTAASTAPRNSRSTR